MIDPMPIFQFDLLIKISDSEHILSGAIPYVIILGLFSFYLDT